MVLKLNDFKLTNNLKSDYGFHHPLALYPPQWFPTLSSPKALISFPLNWKDNKVVLSPDLFILIGLASLEFTVRTPFTFKFWIGVVPFIILFIWSERVLIWFVSVVIWFASVWACVWACALVCKSFKIFGVNSRFPLISVTSSFPSEAVYDSVVFLGLYQLIKIKIR